MVASFALIRSTAYYTRQSSIVCYYEAGTAAGGTWLRGHERLGVVEGSAVQAADFDRVCQGHDRDGRLLAKAAGAGRRGLGVDLTLSSPKAVSVLWAFGDEKLRETIAAAERQAVEATLRLIEQEIPLARRGHSGFRRERAQLLAAVFTHSESRPESHADGSVMAAPQRHHHLTLPNIAERADGTWGGIDTVALRTWKKTLGSAYRLSLATALQERGFAIEVAEDDWRWSIRGVPAAVCRFFSARRNTLEEELSEAGVSSSAAPALAAALTLSGRRQKEIANGGELTQLWRFAIERLGFAPAVIVEEAFAAGRESQAEHCRQERARLAKERLAAVPAKLTERSSTFERRLLLETAANALVGSGATAEAAVERADALIAADAIVELGQTRDGPVYSTRQMIAIERDLVQIAQRLAASQVNGPDRSLVDRLVTEEGLNDEQAAVARAATAGTRLTLVQGGAGTGKSTTLRAITAAWQSAGYTVVGAAVAWRAAHTMRDDLGIKARAIDSFLARADMRRAIFDPRTVLLVEEAGLQSSPQARRLLQEVERANGICIAVGDEGQIRPLGPGHGMRLIRESVGAVEIATVVRQREQWAREAPVAFARGDAEKALRAFSDRDLVRLHDGPRAAVEALVDEWQRQDEAAPDQSVLIAAKTNAEVRAISAAVRGRMRERGALRGPDFSLPASDASGNGYTLRLAAGDRVRFLVRRDELGVVNGTEAVVTDIRADADGKIRISAQRGDERVTFAPSDLADAKGRTRLALAYCSTLFGAQGITVDQTLVLLSPRFDRHDSYVAASRARGNTTFFVDARSLDREMAETGPENGGANLGEVRLAYLASKLARTTAKTTTLDILAAPPEVLHPRHRIRDRRPELSHEF